MTNPNHIIMQRKELLMRQNEDRRQIQKYIFNLNEILKMDVKQADFLDLEITDSLTNKFLESYKSSSTRNTRTYKETGTEILEGDIKVLRQRLQNREAFLITKLSEVCGVVKVPAFQQLINTRS